MLNFVKKRRDYKNILIKKSLRAKFLEKKICTQGFNDMLSDFGVTFFKRPPKIIFPKHRGLWVYL